MYIQYTFTNMCVYSPVAMDNHRLSDSKLYIHKAFSDFWFYIISSRNLLAPRSTYYLVHSVHWINIKVNFSVFLEYKSKVVQNIWLKTNKKFFKAFSQFIILFSIHDNHLIENTTLVCMYCRRWFNSVMKLTTTKKNWKINRYHQIKGYCNVIIINTF